MPSAESLPEYPRLTELQEYHRETLTEYFLHIEPRISELTFAYLWSWREHTNCRLARYQNCPLLVCDLTEKDITYAFPPLGADRQEQADLIVSLLDEGGPITRFARVTEELAELLKDVPDLRIEPKRERADYVHRADTLRELPGSEFHAKRNLIRQFERECPEAEFHMINPPLAARCAHFSQKWLDNHPKNNLPSLQREVKTTQKMLGRMDWLDLSGGALLDGDSVVAFALGEPLNSRTFIERVEKADTSYPGSYQAINQAFAQTVAEGYEYINREQDMGVEGLRRAKQSYHPDHLVRKHVVEWD